MNQAIVQNGAVTATFLERSITFNQLHQEQYSQTNTVTRLGTLAELRRFVREFGHGLEDSHQNGQHIIEAMERLRRSPEEGNLYGYYQIIKNAEGWTIECVELLRDRFFLIREPVAQDMKVAGIKWDHLTSPVNGY